MKLYTIHTGNFKLDGGAMFGVVPKMLWNNLNPADEKNLCNWAMRCLLVETGDRRILIDCGIGDKQSDKFFGFYYLNGMQTLKSSLLAAGFNFEDITDVLLTHLHFDHVGGAVVRNDQGLLEPAFPNAVYHVTESHWKHAVNPNAREKASFLSENFIPLYEAGKINFVSHGDNLASGFDIRVVDGHTKGMITPLIDTGSKHLVYCADLIPSSCHIPVNYVMGYDIEPLITMQEKENLYASDADLVYYFEHDLVTECAKVGKNEKGQWVKTESGSLTDFI